MGAGGEADLRRQAPQGWRAIVSEARQQTVLAQTPAAGGHMSTRVGGHTCARATALAVQEGPPIPAARPGPNHGKGRALPSARPHGSTASARGSNAEDESRPIFARMAIPQPAQACEGCSAHDSGHGDMLGLGGHSRIETCGTTALGLFKRGAQAVSSGLCLRV